MTRFVVISESENNPGCVRYCTSFSDGGGRSKPKRLKYVLKFRTRFRTTFAFSFAYFSERVSAVFSERVSAVFKAHYENIKMTRNYHHVPTLTRNFQFVAYGTPLLRDDVTMLCLLKKGECERDLT